MTKIGVLGIGAIGTVTAFELQKNKAAQLYYFSRRPQNTLNLIQENSKIQIPAKVQTNATEVPQLDWLIICLKAYHYKGAKDWFEDLIHPNLKIAVIRNGIKLKSPLLKWIAENQILECMIDCPTERDAEGYYKPLKNPLISVPKGELATDFESLFKDTAIRLQQMDDFKTANWEKLCESSALGAVLCLTGETCWIFEDEKMITLYTDLMQEAIAVAKADGALIKPHFLNDMLVKLKAYPKTKGSSMLTDRIMGNPIELEAKNGIISTLGKQYGIKTPVNDLFVKLLTHTNQSKHR